MLFQQHPRQARIETRKIRRVLYVGVSLLMVVCASVTVVLAQPFPSKGIRIVTAEAGAGADFAARLIAQGLTENLGQRTLVDNRGVNAIDIVAKSRPDGYTLLLYGPTLWLLPYLQDHVTYDPLKDFLPVTAVITTPNVLVTHPSLPAKSVKELIALAKARPGELNYGSGATGGSIHLSGELFKVMAGVDIVRIAYKGISQAIISLIGGQIQLMFPNAPTVMPHIKSGRLKGMAVTSAQPSLLAPGLPTMAESGLPGYESAVVFGMFLPAGTPRTLLQTLNQEIVKVLNKPEVKADLFKAGVETVASSPDDFAAAVRTDMAR